MKKLPLLLLLTIIYSASVLVRLPMLEEKVHSWQAGNIFMLTTLEIWHEKGISKSHFSPIQTWPNEGDKYMHLYKRLEDSEGNNYYTSHPPFTFQLAHFVFSLTGSKPTQRVLKGLGLLFHFITSLGIFWLVYLLSRNALSSLLAFTVCTFYPVLMYGFTFHYFSEIVGLSFWAVCMAGFYWIIKYEAIAKRYWLLLGLAIFLFTYTDWLGVFFTASVLLYLFKAKPYGHKRLGGIIVISCSLALLLILIQYSSIAGVSAFLHSMAIRFSERSGFFGEAYSDQQLSLFNAESYQMLAEQFHHQLKWIGYFFVLLTIAFGLFMRKQMKVNSAFQPLLFLLFIPALLHFIIFFNTNVIHYVYQAKWAIIVAVLTGLMIGAIQNQIVKWATIGMLGIVIVASCIFLRSDIPTNPTESEMIKVAEEIKSTAKPHQALFTQTRNLEEWHYLCYQSKRNIMIIDKGQTVLEISQERGKEESIVFISENGLITDWIVIPVKND